MLDRSRVLLLGALFAGAVTFSGKASADMVLDAGGKWFPAPAEGTPPAADDSPPDEMVAGAADFKVDATYETVTVKSKNFTRPAGAVRRIIASDSLSGQFREAMNDASSAFYEDAADKFKTAADELQGFGKQSALYFRVQAYVDGGDVAKALTACDDLIQQFPKSFYFCDVQILRAKVAAMKNVESAADDVTKILAAVSSAPGMNNRDLFRAEWTRIYLTLETRRKFDEAEKAYRDLVSKVEKTDAVQGETVRQQALVGIGNCLVAGKKEAEARTFFEKATESRNSDVLAGAYLGLGNIAYAEAKALRDGGKLPEAKAKLQDAVAHYLRVTCKYKTEVEDSSPVLDALVNQARVFVILFEMSANAKERDCESAERAWKSYQELVNMPSVGSARNTFIKEFKAFDEKKKAACSVPPPAEKPADKPADKPK